ncbi:hypothetical protein ACTMU2_00100 [Cupriavidus basilensis]
MGRPKSWHCTPTANDADGARLLARLAALQAQQRTPARARGAERRGAGVASLRLWRLMYRRCRDAACRRIEHLQLGGERLPKRWALMRALQAAAERACATRSARCRGGDATAARRRPGGIRRRHQVPARPRRNRKRLRAAGVRTVMLTGDNKEGAAARVAGRRWGLR